MFTGFRLIVGGQVGRPFEGAASLVGSSLPPAEIG